MKILKKIFYALLVLIILLLITGLIIVRYVSHTGMPAYSGTINLKGLSGEVTVTRDELGIPHIYAGNEKDLYTAVGYVMAQDRLWQMDLLRRVTLGRLSEIFGSRMLQTDELLRALRYSDKSRKILAMMDSSQLDALNAFCSGVNEYIEQAGSKLPPEFKILRYRPEPFEPVSCVNLIGYMAWDLRSGWSEMMLDQVRPKVSDSLYRELIPGPALRKTLVYPAYTRDSLLIPYQSSLLNANTILEELGLHVFQGSNNWAVSGKKSSTGRPILCNDMHLGLNVPGIWYQIHEVVPGKLDVSGLVLPGQPFVICGHNQRIAWGMTNVTVDNVDFYEERLKDGDSTQYQVNGEWKNIESRKEIIRIKGGTQVERTIRYTYHGPIVSGYKGIKGKVVTMHWVGDEMSNELRTVYLLNRAGNWKEFTDAISTFKATSQNIVYADVDGNIGLYCAAGVPIRNRDYDGFILPGWTGKYDWKGFVPFENLPHTFNPACGFVSSANNKTVGDDYPYHIGTWFALPSRIDRIRELLEKKQVLSTADMKTIQNDQHSVLARGMNSRILELMSAVKDEDNKEKLAMAILSNWKEGDMNKELIAPAVFETFYLKLAENLMKDEMGSSLYQAYLEEGGLMKFAIADIWSNPASGWWDDVTTPQKETMTDIVRKSLRGSVDWLTSACGSDTAKWKWGNIHTLTLAHPLGSVAILDKLFHLNRGPIRVGGSSHTVSPYSYPFANPFKADHGSSHRHIYSIADWDSSYTVIPTGNSGIPASKFYCNQTNMYINGIYHGEYFSDASVKKHGLYTLVLKNKDK